MSKRPTFHFAFKGNDVIYSSQRRPRIYLTRKAAEKGYPAWRDGEAEFVEYGPIKRGEWMRDCMESKTIDDVNKLVTFVSCSECREVSGKKTNYCPNCGAKMGLIDK